MLSVLTMVLLSAAADGPVRLAMNDLRTFNVDEKQAAFFTEHLAQQIKLSGAEVITPRELGSLLGLERQKQLIGCGEEASACMAELASALGTDGLLLGDLGRAGDKLQINLKVVSAVGKTIAAFSDRVVGDEAALDALTRAAHVLAQQAAQALHRPLQPKLSASGGSSSALSLWWAPAALGVGTAALGAVFFGLSAVAAGRLRAATSSAPLDDVDAVALKSNGANQQIIGVAMLVIGAALVAVGGVMFALKPSAQAAVSIVPLADGASVVFAGRF